MACMLGLAQSLASGAPSTFDQPATIANWVQAGMVHMPYASTERLGSVVVNRESGNLTGAAVRLGLDLRAGTLALALQQTGGTLNYRGLTQFGLPLQTQTQLRMDLVGLTVSPAWSQMTLADARLTAQFGVQLLRIDRQIEPTAKSARLQEQLRLDLLVVGLRWRHPLSDRTELNLAVDWSQPVRAALRVDAGGVIDTHTLRPRHRGWPAADVALHRTLGGGLSASIGLRLEQPQIGSAPAVVITRQGLPAGLSAYPGSHQRLHSLAVGLHWAH